MLFKISSKNPYRDFVRNCRRIAISNESSVEKVKNYKELKDFLGSKLVENERYLVINPAFASRCEHWNQLDIRSIKPVKNTDNPWLCFKREFEKALQQDYSKDVEMDISKALAWFYSRPYKEDWLA